jgi:hypothetical protein
MPNPGRGGVDRRRRRPGGDALTTIRALFTFSDAPIFEKLSLLRAETITA